MTEAPGNGGAASEGGDNNGSGEQNQQDNAPKYGQLDLNKAAGSARDEGKKTGSEAAINGLLQELEFESVDDIKALASAYKEAQKQEQTETERIQGEYEKLQEKHKNTSNRTKELESKAKNTALRSEARIAALEAGARPDRVEALINQSDLSEVDITEGDDGFAVDNKALNKALKKTLDVFTEWRLTGPQDVGEVTSGAPAQTPADVNVDFAAMSDAEFDKYLARAKQEGIPLSALR